MKAPVISLRGPRPDPVAATLCDVGERFAGILVSQRRLSRSPTIDFHARRRIEAVIAGLIEALDEIDGEGDREQTATEGAGAGFRRDPTGDDAENGHDREAMSDDNALADADGALEQGHWSIGAGAFG